MNDTSYCILLYKAHTCSSYRTHPPTDRDLSDGDGDLFGVGSTVDCHAQLLVDLIHRNCEYLSTEVGVASKRHYGVCGWGRRRGRGRSCRLLM